MVATSDWMVLTCTPITLPFSAWRTGSSAVRAAAGSSSGTGTPVMGSVPPASLLIAKVVGLPT